MPEEIDRDRRRFLGAALTTIAGAELSVIGSMGLHSSRVNRARETLAKPVANTSFARLKQIDADVLSVGYAEDGPADGPTVVLLHGWPYDIHSYVDVAPMLAAKGYRVIVPHLRGYGTTRFRSDETLRNGQQSAIAVDTIALMDALGIEKAIVGGFDWGARTAVIMAALWPERCKALVSVSGYLVTNPQANLQPLPPRAELGWWYQYYFATERGVLGYSENRYDVNKLIWKLGSPKWDFDDATFDRTARSFDESSKASATTCLKKRRRPSRKRSSTSITFDRPDPPSTLRTP